MNLNKYTKTELISKLKQQNLLNQNLVDKIQINDKKVEEKTWFRSFLDVLREIVNIFNLIKELFLKITLISLLIKFIKKFPIIQSNVGKLWNLIKRFIFFGFGTAILDIFNFDYFKKTIVLITFIYEEGLETLSNFLADIKDYWTTSSKSDSKNDSEIDSNIDFNESNNPFVTSQSEAKTNTENKSWNWYSIAYYSTIIVAGCLIYVYWNEIKEILDNFKNDGPDDNNTPTNTDLVDLKGKAKEAFTKDPLKNISETINNKTYFEVTSTGNDLSIKNDGRILNLIKTKIEDEDIFEVKQGSTSTSTNMKNISPTESTSSVETITQNIDKMYIQSVIEDLNGKTVLYQAKVLSELGDLKILVNQNWKLLIDKNVSNVIEFIETNIPTRIFEKDTNFVVESLIKIEKLNNEMLTDIVLFSNTRTKEETLLLKLITENCTNWIEEKRNYIRNLKL